MWSCIQHLIYWSLIPVSLWATHAWFEKNRKISENFGVCPPRALFLARDSSYVLTVWLPGTQSRSPTTSNTHPNAIPCSPQSTLLPSIGNSPATLPSAGHDPLWHRETQPASQKIKFSKHACSTSPKDVRLPARLSATPYEYITQLQPVTLRLRRNGSKTWWLLVPSYGYWPQFTPIPI